MADGGDRIALRAVSRIGEIGEAAWDRCAGPDNPFLSHAFLHALEESGAVQAKTGWQPQHLVLTDSHRGVIGAAPVYLKTHSYGEYVFDHGWANAYERAGGKYYPKLQAAVPFTPATGPRLLVAPGADVEEVRRLLIGGLVELARQLNVSSLHVTFPTEPEYRALGAAGFLQRVGEQFHWENRGYATFEDFLAQLTSRKRKMIRRERREAAETGLTMTALTGGAIERRHWDAFFRFYMDTSNRKWGHAYLNRAFFQLLGEGMAEKIVLMMALRDGEAVAGALNLLGTDTLFGRNWGCGEDFRFLHFELCYYRAIDFAIERGLKKVEAGAQGPHKIQRGYLPEPTYSAHWIADPQFRRAVENYLTQERIAIAREMAALEDYSPFRQDPLGAAPPDEEGA